MVTLSLSKDKTESSNTFYKCTHALQMSKAHLVSVTKTSPYGCASTLVFYINFQILNVTLSLSKGKPNRHAKHNSASHPTSQLRTSQLPPPKTLPTKNCPLSS